MARKRKSCIERALGMLSRRAYSVFEVRSKLSQYGYEDDEIAKTIERLQGLDYLDDEQFTRAWVRYRAEISGWGPRRILMDLKQKGVDESLAQTALAAWEALEDEKRDTFAPLMVDKEAERGKSVWHENAEDLLHNKFGPWPEGLKELSGLVEWEEKQAHYKAVQKEKARRLNFLLRRGFNHDEAMTALEKVMNG